MVADGGDGFGDAGQISKRSLDRYSKVLSLSPEQKEAAQSLLDGYLAENKAAAKEAQSAMESAFAAFQDSQDHKALGEATRAAQRKRSERSAALEKAYFEDLRTLLTPEQDDQWAKVERLRRREKGLLNGSLSGESVDLTEVIDELNLPPATLASLGEAVEQYEADMDRAIQARDAALAGSRPAEFGPDMTFDLAAMQAAMAKAREAGAQVRDVNQMHERRIEPLLPEDRRADFAEAFKRRCFPEVYAETAVARSMKAAAALDDLTAEQKSSLSELQAGYERQARPASDAWADAVAASEAEGKDGAIAMGGAVMRISFGDDTGPVAEARKARKALDTSAREKLKAILTPAQLERLPKQQEAGGEFVTGGNAVMIRNGG